jgi:hypothetical protein
VNGLPKQGKSSRSEQGDALGDRGPLEAAVECGERETLAFGKFEIGCVVDGQVSFPRERHQRVVTRQ